MQIGRDISDGSPKFSVADFDITLSSTNSDHFSELLVVFKDFLGTLEQKGFVIGEFEKSRKLLKTGESAQSQHVLLYLQR